MLAIPISREPILAAGRSGPARTGGLRSAYSLKRWLPLVAAVSALGFKVPAATNEAATRPLAGETNFAAQAQRIFLEARSGFEARSNGVESAWQFGRAAFDRAEFATTRAERAALAQQGIAACREAIARASNSAPAHYYLAMDLGQLARTKTLGALGIVREMEREFKLARDLDEHFDYAGPDRNLGLLYLQAPTIGSIGSRSNARLHLQRAVELAPDYPENRLNLIEACLKWNDRSCARRELDALEELWPRARLNFPGDHWAANWADWEARLKTARKSVEEPVKPIESPRTRS